ncbi:hypothetical protein BUALT_Bualt02G0121400 [Buddleja alternifolia]|uniref:RRM domain-containing protein n=1 Tax=Buddleja alternifolia TaxID=168488 RepID=A0AAV6YAM6_9LAMI|nr:hypothetical protein BUALT_Bualt02G0121400 [Buddleja alternifolia]
MDYGVPEQNFEEPQYDGHYEAEQGNYGSIDNVDDSAGLKHDSSSSAGKLFVGGIAWETSEASGEFIYARTILVFSFPESFSRYFRKYGEITDSVIMMDKITGRPRGFGFITFADAEVADKVLEEDHVIDGRAVEVKRTVPREDMHVRGVSKTKKIFVGGIPVSLNEDDLREYFSSFGNIVEHQIMMDHTTGRSRGFGFVTFENEDAVERILSNGRMHELGGKQVEIKRAEPKRSGFEHSSTDNRFRRGGSSSKYSGNFASDSEGFAGGYGGKMGRAYGGYGGYGGYGNFAGNYAAGAAGFYPGYGGYGYGYGFGGPMYGGGAYGGGAYGTSAGYGGAAGYGKGYGGSGGGYDGGEGFGGGRGGGSGSYGPGKGYGGGGGGGYGGSKGYGNGNATMGRFHPYRK